MNSFILVFALVASMKNASARLSDDDDTIRQTDSRRENSNFMDDGVQWMCFVLSPVRNRMAATSAHNHPTELDSHSENHRWICRSNFEWPVWRWLVASTAERRRQLCHVKWMAYFQFIYFNNSVFSLRMTRATSLCRHHRHHHYHHHYHHHSWQFNFNKSKRNKTKQNIRGDSNENIQFLYGGLVVVFGSVIHFCFEFLFVSSSKTDLRKPS